MATKVVNCDCCCPCNITLARTLHGTCTTPADSDVAVDPLDCDDEPTGGAHTFGAGVTLRYRRGTTIVFTADGSLGCGVDDDLAFAVWTIEGDTACIVNLADFSGPVGGVYCFYRPDLEIQLAGSGDCDLTLTVHYAHFPLFNITCECVKCYIDGDLPAACDDSETEAWATPCA